MTLADKAILSGADNRPPMLEKDMYDSWKSRMELYMMNRQHGRMILESVENVDCDVKAINIILQGLPPEVYALVSNHKLAKELWERIQLLMQGTSLTKQERECKLYDEFDKFAYKKGETLLTLYYMKDTRELCNDTPNGGSKLPWSVQYKIAKGIARLPGTNLDDISGKDRARLGANPGDPGDNIIIVRNELVDTLLAAGRLVSVVVFDVEMQADKKSSIRLSKGKT
ncbi:hypothetical protein Tco_1568874 [Tanacetum coccineum]